MNGNWSQLDMESLNASATQAALALTMFWAMTTAGRVLFAVIGRWFPSRLAYHVLPFLLAGAFVLIAALPAGAPGLGILAFALAGLGCSALLPLTISFGQEKLVTLSGGVAGGIIAFYQIGYGIAAFGVGPLRSAGITLAAVFGISAGVAFGMGLLSFAVAHHRPSPASLHPRPARRPRGQRRRAPDRELPLSLAGLVAPRWDPAGPPGALRPRVPPSPAAVPAARPHPGRDSGGLSRSRPAR